MSLSRLKIYQLLSLTCAIVLALSSTLVALPTVSLAQSTDETTAQSADAEQATAPIAEQTPAEATAAPVEEQVPAELSADSQTEPAPVEPSADSQTEQSTQAEGLQLLYLPVVAADSVGLATYTEGPQEPGNLNYAAHDHDDYALAEAARQRNEPPFDINQVEIAATGPLNQVGQWGAVTTWPFAFATAASLPDGRIIAWGGNNTTSFSGGTTTYASVWDPATGQFLSRNNAQHSMFCAIPTMLEDGRVFVNGGDGTRERTSIFDYRNNSWTRAQDMSTGRWYNGAVALPNGKVFTMLGDPGGPYPELWTPNAGWSLLTGANLNNGVLNFTGYQSTWLPILHLAPNGQIFHSGPTTQMNWLNPTGNGSISNAGLTNTWYPKYSTAVMYEEGKILVAGGAANSTATAPGTNQAMVIDLTGATPQKTVVTSMALARKFNNGVVLPTGEVMIIGGNTSGTEFSDAGTQLEPEIWNPDTRTWRRVANHSVPRNYHSVALLMTDGRVWSGGGGLCACSADHPDHQVYSPPYLFNADGSLATRPTITAAPNVIGYGNSFSVQATAGIAKFNLIKMSGVTHNLNSDLRLLKVPFTSPSSGQYQLTVSSNSNVLTPGYWMLFALNSAGVPSVAKVIQVVSSMAPTIVNPGAQSTLQGTAVNLPISASDPNGDVLSYSATGLPTGLAINSSSGVIAGTVTTAGNYQATVTVSDGSNNTATTFAWTIFQPGTIRYVKLEALSEVNGNPWTSAAEFNVLDGNGALISRTGWTVTADSQETAGEDGRAVNVSDGNTSTIWHTQWQAASPAHPHWLVVDLGAAYTVGGFRYLPRQNAANGRIANYKFYVSTDGVNWSGAVAQGTFPNSTAEQTVTIAANRPPVLTNPGNQTSNVAATINLPLSAIDPDGDTLTYSATGLPAGLAINSSSGVISGAPTTASTANVTVSVTDNRGGAASQSFTWTINPPALSINPLVSPPKVVNSAINYTASVNNGINPRYKWLFGDNTPETAYSTSPTSNHTFTQPGIYVIKVTATDDRGVEQSTNFVQAIHLPLTANRAVASMNIAYEVRSGANGRVWAVNQDNDTVSVFDAVTNSKVAEINVGSKPRSVAVAPNGNIWVTNKGAATISIISPSTLAVVQTVNLPYASQPFGLAFAPNGSAAFVALEAGNKVLKLDPATGAQTGSVDVGPNVRQLAISSDSSKVYGSRFITPRLAGEETGIPNVNSGVGEILVVNAASLSINQTMGLRHSDKPDIESAGRGLPNYLGVLAISPDGVNGWVPSKQDNLLRGTLRDGNNLNFQNTVRAISSRIDLTTDTENYPARMDHDNAGVASTALFNHTGNYLFVALETNREVAVVDSYGQRELFRIPVGRAPQGLALAPDGLKLYVHNFMDRSITALDISPIVNEGKNMAPAVATYSSVATEKLSAQVLAGKQLFYDAKDTRLARDSYISCASCHNDGGQDGRVWDLTGFGEGLRNTINLQGRAGLGHGFLHWSSNFDEVQDFEGQIRTLAGGTGLMTDAQFNTGTRSQSLGDAKAGISSDLDALAAYVSSLTTFASSPYRNGDGTLTADGNAGKTIFQNKNCAQCHNGANFTESGANILRNIGTIKPSSGSRLGGVLPGLDTPTLRDVWATAPYLHDGSANTLTEAVRAHTNVAVADSEVAQLVAYLQQIDGNEPAPFNPPPTVNLTAPTNGTTVNQGATINLSADASDNSGTVSKVEFYAGTTLLNIDTTAPFAFSWTNATAGSHALTAKAYDGLGASATSTAVNITVNAILGTGAGLTAHYFNNVTLDGNPALQRTEAVNFGWATSAPGTGVNADNFSVRWIGQVEAPSTGVYQFQTSSDDGVRLWVNGVVMVDNWTDHGVMTNTSGNISLTANTKYHIRMEFYERGGDAVARLLWKLPSATAFVPVPADRLYAVTNVAQGKTSSQSSTANSGAAARAVDGNTNGTYSGNSVTHTNYNSNAWWQTDLGGSYAINSIMLWNRTDCCANRLSNFYVFVSASNMSGRSYSSLVNDSTVWRYQVTGQAPTKLNIPANVNGRYVRVQLAGTNYLSLAEVQVWAR